MAAAVQLPILGGPGVDLRSGECSVSVLGGFVGHLVSDFCLGGFWGNWMGLVVVDTVRHQWLQMVSRVGRSEGNRV